jgi:transcriptional regulator with XRE-family HTH domain
MRIREIREDKDLTQSDIAKILNVSQVAYSFYEIGKRQLPIDLLIKLAEYYNTSTDYLLELTDIREPYPDSLKKKENKKSNKL